jgi:hypothetical protein
MRLTLRFVVRLEDALRLKLVARLEALLFAGDFVFEVEDAQGRRTRPNACFIVSLMVMSVPASATVA